MWIPSWRRGNVYQPLFLSTPLVLNLTKNVNSRKTQKGLFFVPIWNQEVMNLTGESLFRLGSKPSFQKKVPWRGRMKPGFVKQMVGLPPKLPPASLVLSTLFWTSFKSKRRFVFLGPDVVKDLWKPNSLEDMLVHTNVSRRHLAFAD